MLFCEIFTLQLETITFLHDDFLNFTLECEIIRK